MDSKRWLAKKGHESVSNPLIKHFVVENDSPIKISHLNFGLLSNKDMMKVAEIPIVSKELFELPSRLPAKFGVLDPRLGISDKKSACETCGQKLAECVGHVGYIKLELPVFHIGYFKATLEILQNICKSCSRVLLVPEQRDSYLHRMRDPRADVLKLVALRKRISAQCKKQSICPYCSEVNGVVKKVMGSHTLKIMHEKYKHKKAEDLRHAFLAQFSQAKLANKEIAASLHRAQEDLSPLVVQELFEKIPDEDCDLLWANAEFGRPEKLILNAMIVPPVCIRPSVPVDGGGGSNEDDLTVKLQEIIQVNFALKTAINNGASIKMMMEDWDFLQVQVAQFINGEMPGLPKPIGNVKPIRGLCQRLKGKQGRFRGNLSGKRVDFSARTVISPDPNLEITQVGVPVHVAKVMTYPEKVSSYNIDKLRKCVINGPEVHPGANVIRQVDSSFTKNLMYGDRSRLADELKVGDVVERHMEDGDIVLFNRQPSLHKLSIMSHRAKILSWRTFRFNECVCAPYNADFDGDEMNMHLPQTEEARTEATMLMGVQNNLITPRNGEPLVAATQDFLTAGYLMTQKNVFLNRDEFCQIVACIGDANEHIDMPRPAIILPVELWTGKQVFSLLVRPRRKVPVLANFELKERNYTENFYMCRNDGYVCFRNSELLCGNLCKKTLGDGSKKGLFYVLIRDHGEAQAARCMNRVAKLFSRWLGHHKGFSIGIDDVTPSPDLMSRKMQLLKDGYNTADGLIADYKKGYLKLKAGCDAIQSLESDLNGILGKLRETAGKECMISLPFHNNPRIMADCGSKGSALNISQMVACVGQQALGGNRIPNGFINRSLPHFLPNALHAAAKGFVANSFFSGLTATEFFFHTMGGREGLVDTAVKTAETGYMARRLMKALEDLSSQYDKTVRNSEGAVVQFTYGDDGLNPAYMETGDRPVDFDRLLLQVQATVPDRLGKALLPEELVAYGEAVVQRKFFQAQLPAGQKFLDEIRAFFCEFAERIMQLRHSLNMDDSVPVNVQSRKQRANDVNWVERAGVKNSKEYAEASELAINNVHKLTLKQAEELMGHALFKYLRSVMEPGEAVGAIGAQSISEPGTQMTLKTFHFAGVASMNVTLGVPRLKEIINGSKVISTPIITAALVCKHDERSARIVKARIEKTMLGQVAEYIMEVYAPDQAYLSVKLDMNAIEKLHLGIDASTVRKSILKACGASPRSVIKHLKEQHVLLNANAPDTLRILGPEKYKSNRSGEHSRGEYFAIQALKAALPQVIVQGVESVHRAVIAHDEEASGEGGPSYHLLVEGYGLESVMTVAGVDGLHSKSNHIIEVGKTLGIEAARELISLEISFIMGAYGISIDRRHLMLLSDIMTFKGEVLGITRFGIAKMRESVLMLASFEKTTDHLFDAAVHSRTDAIVGVSECIIMGIPIPIGTGLFKLFNKSALPRGSCTKRSGLFKEITNSEVTC